jgi:hypothetical protein
VAAELLVLPVPKDRPVHKVILGRLVRKDRRAIWDRKARKGRKDRQDRTVHKDQSVLMAHRDQSVLPGSERLGPLACKACQGQQGRRARREWMELKGFPVRLALWACQDRRARQDRRAV